jgi:hypothetical protein
LERVALPALLGEELLSVARVGALSTRLGGFAAAPRAEEHPCSKQQGDERAQN